MDNDFYKKDFLKQFIPFQYMSSAMNHSNASSFGLYEVTRIIIPGFYFASLCALFFCTFIFRYMFLPYDRGYFIILFLFLVIVSGLTMYAKETTKRRRAFIENQPSAFLQVIARRHSGSQMINEAEARQMYFYILNHFIPAAFHEKVFFFGTVYHIMIQIRRTSFWFAIISLMCITGQTAAGVPLMEQQGLISFCVIVSLIYLLNVKYNKADRKMQENYQDQIFWLQMNEDLIQDLFKKYEISKKYSSLMKTHSWFQVKILIDEKYQDLLVGLLVLIGFTGFVQEEKFLRCIIPQQKWNNPLKIKFRETCAKFKAEFPSLDLSYSGSIVREENWNEKWERQTGIVEATAHIVIKPSWKKLPNRHFKKLVLHIDPKMSFGTGHHETTRLSLSMIERFLEPNMKVLDFGTGTGVLGITCVKLGAQSVFAIDNDKWAIENTKENVNRNDVQKRMIVRQGSVSIIPRHNFDLIVANIDFLTISRFIHALTARTRKQGIIILSGILTNDMPVLLKLFAKNALVPIELASENEWTSVALRRM